MGIETSVVVPIYNEAKILRMNAEKLMEYLSSNIQGYEIILCENGSLDDTLAIAKELAERYDNIRYLELQEANLGEALRSGFHAAKGEKVVWFPIDLSVDMDFIPQSLRLLGYFDVVVGSKRLMSDLDRRPLMRRAVSRAYHRFVRGFYDVDFTDTTCVKAYRRNRIIELMDRVPISSTIYETELLVEASTEGLNIVEVPVAVEELRPYRVGLLWRIQHKLTDLLSAKLNRVSALIGVPLFLGGILNLVFLTMAKIKSHSVGGFVNPYAFLLSMLLVISGFQIMTFGLLTNLVLQIRRQVSEAVKGRG